MAKIFMTSNIIDVNKKSLFHEQKKKNPWKFVSYQKAKAKEERWIGSNYDLAKAINKAIIARGLIAIRFFDRVLFNGTSVEGIEKALKYTGKKIKYDYACSKYVLDAKRELYEERIQIIKNNLAKAVRNNKIAREYNTKKIRKLDDDNNVVTVVVRSNRKGNKGYSAFTMSAVASYLEHTYDG